MPPHQMYTIATSNKFAALSDGESDDERPLAFVPKTETPAANVPAVSVPKTAPSEVKPSRGPRKAAERRPRRQPTDEAAVPVSGESHRRSRVTDVEGRTVRPERSTEERLDRRSANPRKEGKGMKKDGGGAHNWGNQTADFGAEGTAVEKPAVAPVEGEEAAESPAAVEESPKITSYDAYKAEQAAARKGEEATREAAARYAAEAAEAERAKCLKDGYKVYEKSAETGEAAVEEKKGTEKKSKKTVAPINFRFAGERTRAPRENEKPSREQKKGTEKKSNVNLEDPNAFPCLEAH